MKYLLVFVGFVLLIVVGFVLLRPKPKTPITPGQQRITEQKPTITPADPLSILAMRQKSYPGSDFTIEETLPKGAHYSRYIASYLSDGHKIYGLLTIPDTEKPEGGFPAIVFLHGHLNPSTYQTLERYVAYQDGFAHSGYVTFKPDLRGHGKSEGDAVTATFSDAYVTDALNVVASFKKHPDVNPSKIGMWGHSMGGGITLRSMVVSKDIKVGVIWAGVVGNYENLYERYLSRRPFGTSLSSPSASAAFSFFQQYGSPSANRKFWNSVDPYNFLADISGPIELHHGTADDSVPLAMSEQLRDTLQKAGKTVELYTYEGADHNLAAPFSTAMQRSIAFFDRYLK